MAKNRNRPRRKQKSKKSRSFHGTSQSSEAIQPRQNVKRHRVKRSSLTAWQKKEMDEIVESFTGARKYWCVKHDDTNH